MSDLSKPDNVWGKVGVIAGFATPTKQSPVKAKRELEKLIAEFVAEHNLSPVRVFNGRRRVAGRFFRDPVSGNLINIMYFDTLGGHAMVGVYWSWYGLYGNLHVR